MDWVVCILALGIYWSALAYSRHLAARRAIRNFSPAIEQVYTDEYWHDDWNRQFISLGGRPVLTEAQEAKIRADLGMPPKHTDTYRPMRCMCCGLPHREWDCDCDECEEKDY